MSDVLFYEDGDIVTPFGRVPIESPSAAPSGESKKIREMTPLERRLYYRRRYHKRTPAQKEAHRQFSKSYYHKHHSKRLAAAHQAAIRNRHKDKFASGDIDSNVELARWIDERKESPCYLCGETGNSIDHMIPLAKDGTHTWDNLAWCCLRCNRAKSDMTIEEYLNHCQRVVTTKFELTSFSVVEDDFEPQKGKHTA